jgi:glutaconyl-CoA/methylmalonyl-CoA decarboxylase subunit gamma
MAQRRYATTVDGETFAVRVEPAHEGAYTAHAGDGDGERVELLAEGSTITLLVGNRVLEVAPSGDAFAARGGVPVGMEARGRGARASASAARSGTVQAPMPGRIVKLLVAPGDQVASGAGLVVMEAMKMENEISAPHSGTVTRVLVGTGDTVERDAPLVELGTP